VVPPVAARVAEYAVPTVPPGREVVVIESGRPEITTIDRLAVAVIGGLWESVTATVKLKVPTVVGVPKMTPVEALRVSPGGSEPTDTDQVSGGFTLNAVRVAEYAVPTWPPGTEVVVIANGRVTEMKIESA